MRAGVLLSGLCCLLLAAAPTARLDPKIHLLDPAYGDAVLTQCSRMTPRKGERYFKPTAAMVAAFEQALQAALMTDEALGSENQWRTKQGYPVLSTKPNDRGRDIIGLERAGRKFLYGNYYSADARFLTGRQGPLIICDGGANYFGAEFDLKTGLISHLAINGRI